MIIGMPKEVQGNKSSPKALPDLHTVFSKAWGLLKTHLWQLCGFTVIVGGINILFVFLFFGLMMTAGIGALSAQMFPSSYLLMFSKVNLTIFLLGMFFIAIMYIVFSVFVQGALITMLCDANNRSLPNALRKSLRTAPSLFLVALITIFFVVGTLWIFLFPGFVVLFFLLFAPFEVVVNGQTVATSIRRSMLFVSYNFVPLLVRMLFLFALWVGVSLFTPTLFAMMFGQHIEVILLGAYISQTVLGWFGICYLAVLYRFLQKESVYQRGSHLLWICTSAVLGWVIGIGILFAGYQLIQTGNLGRVLFPPISTRPVDIAPETSFDYLQKESVQQL